MSWTRRGFTLIEVMVSLGILITSLVILTEMQATSIEMTLEAQRIVTATQLAQDKLTEVLLLMEEEGFGDTEIEDQGDFSDFGDEGLDLDFKKTLDDYKWQYNVFEIDLALAGDVASMAEDLAGGGYWGDSSTESMQSGADEAASQIPSLSSLGIGPDMIGEMLGKYIRQVEVRVWWGQDSKEEEDEEHKDEVLLTAHVINPSGQIIPGSTSSEEGQ